MASFPSAIKTFSTVVNGVTKLVAALFNSPNDEITAIETALGTNMSGVRLGAWVDKSAGYAAQTAPTDAFVLVKCTSVSVIADLYTDANADPSTIVALLNLPSNARGSMMTPVKKGDSWKVVLTSGTIAVYYISMGS